MSRHLMEVALMTGVLKQLPKVHKHPLGGYSITSPIGTFLTRHGSWVENYYDGDTQFDFDEAGSIDGRNEAKPWWDSSDDETFDVISIIENDVYSELK